MYKVSIWLKGGGKIVEECNLSYMQAKNLYFALLSDSGIVNISRSDNDEFPIILYCSQIAAAQIDEKDESEHCNKNRKLETRYKG